MRKSSSTTTVSLSSVRRLNELREASADICEPRYHEFHRNVAGDGFSSITIAKKSRR